MADLPEDINNSREENDGTLSMLREPVMSQVLTIEDELSLNGKNMRCHLTIIKWIGVFLLAITCAAPGFVILGEQHPTDYPWIAVKDPQPQLNLSTCVYAKQFPLHDHVFATVCNQDGYVFVDVRKFVNQTATIIGVELSSYQWMVLKQMSARVDGAISEARTYWNNLKHYRP